MTGKDRHSFDILLNEEVLIPYPKEFRLLDEARQEAEEILEARLSKIEDEKERNRVRAEGWKEMPRDGFNQGGYEWCRKNWGTKWGFCDVELAYDDGRLLEYKFQTAWSPPLPLIRKMGEVFSELTFDLRYFEGGIGFSGWFRIVNNEVVEDREAEYFGNRGG